MVTMISAKKGILQRRASFLDAGNPAGLPSIIIPQQRSLEHKAERADSRAGRSAFRSADHEPPHTQTKKPRSEQKGATTTPAMILKRRTRTEK